MRCYLSGPLDKVKNEAQVTIIHRRCGVTCQVRSIRLEDQNYCSYQVGSTLSLHVWVPPPKHKISDVFSELDAGRLISRRESTAENEPTKHKTQPHHRWKLLRCVCGPNLWLLSKPPVANMPIPLGPPKKTIQLYSVFSLNQPYVWVDGYRYWLTA